MRCIALQRTGLLAICSLFLAHCNAHVLFHNPVERAAPTCTGAPVTPTPSGTVCNVQGSYKTPKVISTKTSTQAVCRDSCVNLATCLSFSFGPKTNCTLYSKKTTAQGFTAGNTGKKFWNKSCFKQVCSCPTGQTSCSGQCYDLKTNSTNCGTCGNVCTNQATTCQGGSCLCAPSSLAAGKPPCAGDCEVDYMNDPYNCGTCGTVCQDPQVCNGAGKCDLCFSDETLCGSTCTDIKSDRDNCGACGKACRADQECGNGTCKCPDGKILCGGVCLNPKWDNANCGACGSICSSPNQCRYGKCVLPWAIVNGDFETGAFDPWQAESYYEDPNSGTHTVDSPGYKSARAAHLTVYDQTETQFPVTSFILQQTGNLNNSANFLLSFYYNISSKSVGPGSFFVQFYDPVSGDAIGDTVSFPGGTGVDSRGNVPGAWYAYQTTYTGKGNPVEISVSLNQDYQGNTTSLDARFDNFSFAPSS